MAIFGLEASDFIAILAVCVAGVSSALTAVIFLKTFSRNRKSEQIKIAREIQDKINTSSKDYAEFLGKNEYSDKSPLEHRSDWLSNFGNLIRFTFGYLRYFTYLVEQKEIDDRSILNYYKKGVLTALGDMDDYFAFIEQKTKGNPNFPPRMSPNAAESREEISKCRMVWEHI